MKWIDRDPAFTQSLENCRLGERHMHVTLKNFVIHFHVLSNSEKILPQNDNENVNNNRKSFGWI